MNGAKVYVVTMWAGRDHPEHLGVLGVFMSPQDAQRAVDKEKKGMGSNKFRYWGEIEEHVIGENE
jgi:hypothetical protein